MHRSSLWLVALLISPLAAGLQPDERPGAAGASPLPAPAEQANCQTFPETGKSVCGRFLSYWREHGGLAQQGYPISGEFPERSEIDGKTYTVQYFERAVFEVHPENRPPYDVLLSLLGAT